MIDLLYPVYFETFDPNLSAGEKNPGGGMATKVLSVKQVLSSRYLVNLVGDIRDVVSNVVVIEPLTPRLSLEEKDFDEWLNQLKACSAKKILYCSEMEICRWSPNFFNEIVALVDVVTANTKYQESIIRTLSGGKVNPAFLCDPIDEFLFQPLQPKKVSIFGAGRISTIKNSEFYIELFKGIKKILVAKLKPHTSAQQIYGDKLKMKIKKLRGKLRRMQTLFWVGYLGNRLRKSSDIHYFTRLKLRTTFIHLRTLKRLQVAAFH